MLLMITVTAASYVPFEPRNDAQRTLRAELRQRLASLRASPGHVLFGSLAGPLPVGADVENALFYNLDASGVFSAMRNGAWFERDPTGPPAGVRYEYDVARAEQEFRHWQQERHLATVAASLNAQPPTLASIWWALRSTPDAIAVAAPSRAPGELFVIQLRVQGPVQAQNDA